MLHWSLLIFAILFEVAGTTSMKLSGGFSKLLPSVFIFLFYAVSFTFMTIALKKLEVGTVYAIWSGVGTALIAIIGVFFFRETFTVTKIFGILLIIGGVVSLNLGGASH